jgi:hypothetical protein
MLRVSYAAMLCRGYFDSFCLRRRPYRLLFVFELVQAWVKASAAGNLAWGFFVFEKI